MLLLILVETGVGALTKVEVSLILGVGVRTIVKELELTLTEELTGVLAEMVFVEVSEFVERPRPPLLVVETVPVKTLALLLAV